MSLFGSSPETATFHTPNTSNKRNTLFDGDGLKAEAGGTGGLFADSDNASKDPASWDFPTPKRQSKANVVDTLLPSKIVPQEYIDVFDSLLQATGASKSVPLTEIQRLLEGTQLTASTNKEILQIIARGGGATDQTFSRGEVNVILALVGLAQEKEELSLDAVDERQKRLPIPSIKYEVLQNPKLAVTEAGPAPDTPTQPPKRRDMASSNNSRPAASSFDDADPWASPALHKGHRHGEAETSHTNGVSGLQEPVTERATAQRTTSQITTGDANNFSSEDTTGEESWTHDQSYGGVSPEGLGSFSGQHGSESAEPTGKSGQGPRAFGAPKGAIHRGVGPVVTVSAMPNKEGMFMFQHRNYEVISARGSSTVIRRYSDFVWLLDCLYKRYPFRLLPLLPPKRVAVNGNHLAANVAFLEKRRRGLVRFLNALVKHSVLKQDQLVVMFLSVPTELAVWRKQASVTVEEEFIPRLATLPDGLEASLPSDLPDTFETARSGIRRSADVYINLCNLLERLAKRNEGMASDSERFSLALEALAETSESTYTIDKNDVPLLNEGLKSTARHMQTSQLILTHEAKGWDEGVLEDLKMQRDALVSAREMFDRKDRYDRDNIPKLERQIGNNETKLATLRSRPEVKPGEIERVQDAINRDTQSIREQRNRGVLVKECIRDELRYFQQTQYHVGKMHQDWSLERVKYSEMQADNWRTLSEELDTMPIGE